MATLIYGFTSLNVADGNSLKEINGALLNDADMALGIYNSQKCFYQLDANSGATESLPDIVSPSLNAGTKRWILKACLVADITTNGLTASKPVFTDANKKLVSTGTLGVDQGGTGASTFTDHGILYGNGASAIGATATGNSSVLVTNGSGVPSLATDIPTAVTIGSAYIYRAGGTDIPVSDGGTGASTLTDHGVLVGSGTSAITALTVGTNGQVLVGSTGADPVFATITDGEGITTTAGAGTLTIACEDASTSNKGVVKLAGNTKALAGTDTASAVTPDDLKYVLGYHRHSGADLDGAGALDYAVTTGTGTAYALSLSPPLEAYIEGLPIFFKAHVANTGAATLNVNGLGAIAMRKKATEALVAGDIIAGQILIAQYDGTYFQIITGPAGGLALGETSETAYRGDLGKTAYDHSQAAHAPSDANNYTHPNHSGDVTSSGDGAQTIAAKAVTLAKMADLAQNRILGRVSSGAGVPEALTPANVRTIAEINDVDTERAKRLWRLVPSANYTACPPSTSTITMLANMTATIKPGMSLRYTWNDVEYFGQVAAITDELLTVRGAPLSTSYDVSNLQFGGGVVHELVLPVAGTYEDADNTALLASDNAAPVIWLKEASYAVHYRVWSRKKDTGATAGKASVRINDAELNSSAGGLTISADATWYSTDVNINVSNYDIQQGEAIEVTATKGTNGDAEDLCVILIIITP